LQPENCETIEGTLCLFLYNRIIPGQGSLCQSRELRAYIRHHFLKVVESAFFMTAAWLLDMLQEIILKIFFRSIRAQLLRGHDGYASRKL